MLMNACGQLIFNGMIIAAIYQLGVVECGCLSDKLKHEFLAYFHVYSSKDIVLI